MYITKVVVKITSDKKILLSPFVAVIRVVTQRSWAAHSGSAFLSLCY